MFGRDNSKTVTKTVVDPATFNKFSPLSEIDPRYWDQLAKSLSLTVIAPDEIIIRKAREANTLHFLVSGKIEIRESFEQRVQYESHDPRCSKAIEHGLAQRSTVKALEESVVMKADLALIEKLIANNQNYTIHHLDEGELPLPETAIIDDSFQEDWDNVFIQSPLAANLSHQAIHQLFSSFERIEVKQGDTIIKQNTHGDYFFIIKQGFAEVKTDPAGPYRGETFTLTAGNYFGDEALVAKTIRNSTVTMKTDGVLGRLSHDAFNELIRNQLVTSSNDQTTSANQETRLIDVRFPVEYRQQHQQGSQNIPIGNLRKELGDFKKTSRYLIAPMNDCRSELATYLLRQAGYEAYCLTG